MKLNFEGLGEFSNQNDCERCVLVPKMTISIHVNAKNNLDRDLGQFCFLFIPRQDDYGGLLPMKQDLLPAWYFWSFAPVQVPPGPLRNPFHQVWPSYEC